MAKVCTCPSRKLANALPVFATPGKSLPTVLNANDPVGDGGWTTLSRSHRQSSPIFMEWRPLSHVSESATCVTPVLKSEAVFVGDPSCWYPFGAKVGRVLGNCPFDGIPGMLSAAPAADDNETALRWTARRVSPMR